MNKAKSIFSRILSMLIVAIMITGTVPLSVMAADETTSANAAEADGADNTGAADDAAADGDELDPSLAGDESELDPSLADQGDDGEIDPSIAGDGGETDSKSDKSAFENKIESYLTASYEAPEAKLAEMTKRVSAYGFDLYVDEISGEVAYVDTKTGDIQFTNPYDVGTAPGSTDTKQDLLSQLYIEYTDSTGSTSKMNSYVQAASKEQIIVKNLKSGIRVEYALGDVETRYLVPMVIEKESYETKILEKASLDDEFLKKLNAYYVLYDPNDSTKSQLEITKMQTQYPITKEMAVYVFDTTASVREIKQIENYIKTYCPEYTYATLEEDHTKTQYVSTQKAPALFRMALEYYLDEDGLRVRLPANGIRFDEDEYQLSYVRVLPYFGAGSTEYTGYTFLPDGSGALFDFASLASQQVTISGKVYGTDYAYHEIGTVKSENIVMPVYGVVQTYTGNRATMGKTMVPEKTNEDTGVVTPEHEENIVTSLEAVNEDRGYVAIIEEGESLSTLTTAHGGTVHKYNSVYTEFYPRPTDSYNLSDSVSVGDDTVWTVVSKRKYAGSLTLRIVSLTDNDTAEQKGIDDYYESSWEGMAKAYRDFLEKQGVITLKKDTDDDIPLYIESFGAIDTDSTFLTIPVTKKVALTTFDDLKTMTEELGESGIKNINYRLTGFMNGGMISTVPNDIKFEKIVGGNKGYSSFIEYASENGIGVFPDFDFAYSQLDKSFDGFSYKSDAIRSIDNRYLKKRVYSSTYQYVYPESLIAISPSVFDKFYTNVEKNLSDLGAVGISASTLGSDLNSDFDKKDPYNREDSKRFVQLLLNRMNEDFGNVMIDGGNAYTWQYADHILNVTLDSSHYNASYRTVPFIGMVLHGYTNFAGKPTNMSNDINYETLKMLENGALPYFTLSYRNTPLLKDEPELSKYYSVSYDIWKDDLIATYNTLNSLLGGVQTSRIDDHEFLSGQRVPDEDELAQDEADVQAALEASAAAQAARQAEIERQRNYAAANGLTFTEPEPEAPATAPDTTAKYIINDGTIVRVTYENGTSYILNYNRFTVTVDGYTLEPLGYVQAN